MSRPLSPTFSSNHVPKFHASANTTGKRILHSGVMHVITDSLPANHKSDVKSFCITSMMHIFVALPMLAAGTGTCRPPTRMVSLLPEPVMAVSTCFTVLSTYCWSHGLHTMLPALCDKHTIIRLRCLDLNSFLHHPRHRSVILVYSSLTDTELSIQDTNMSQDTLRLTPACKSVLLTLTRTAHNSSMLGSLSPPSVLFSASKVWMVWARVLPPSG